MKGKYCSAVYPPTIESVDNSLLIKYITAVKAGFVTGFVAYYESLGPVPYDITSMAAFRRGAHYSKAVAFLMSPLLDVQTDKHCLTFFYSMRSNLRTIISSHANSVTLANWVVDGGRAFHRAALPLPQGTYKLIWETTDGRRDVGEYGTPYNRNLVTVDQIRIHALGCIEIGMFLIVTFFLYVA